MRMIKEGVRFNLKTWPVILLLLLAWIFTAIFPILFAAMGGLALEMENPDTWTGTGSTTAGMQRLVTNDSVAEYPLLGSHFNNRTQFATINVPLGWSAVVNTTNVGGSTRASLFVIPPPEAPPTTYAQIEVRATTGPRVDTYRTLTAIAPDFYSGGLFSACDLELSAGEFGGKAGSVVAVSFNVTNIGTLPDAYNISATPMTQGWGISARVNGTDVPIKVREMEGAEPRGPGGFGETFKIKYFQLELPPGASARCEFRFSTKSDSARHNGVSIAFNSQENPLVYGSYQAAIKLSETKKTDLTGEILYGQTMSLQVWFALLLAAVVGSRMISTDLAEKSYNLYFARPLTKTDYLAGKFGTAGTILSLATVVPTLVVFGFLLLLSNISSAYVVDHLWVWGAILGQGLVIVLTFSTLSLAFSSMTARRFYAAAAMVVIYLVTAIMGQLVTGAFQSKYGRLIGIADNFDVTGRTAFGIAENLDLGFPWWYSLAALVAIWAVCAFLVWYKIERTELSE